MKGMIRAAAMVFLLAPGVSWAEDLDAGLNAFNAGEYETAYEIWQPIAEQGVAVAQYSLGVMYYDGLGVAQDYAEAVQWYRAAAEQGNAGAQFNLGLMYLQGRGVAQDFVTAHMWLNIAASSGHANAREARDVVHGQMTPEAIAQAQRRARICMESDYQDCD